MSDRDLSHTAALGELASIMGELKTELRHLGLWEPTPPPADALASQEPFCFDTLKLTQWLQWVFVPRVRRLVSRNEALPEHSAIHPLAEEYFRGTTEDASRVLRLIQRFDAVVNAHATGMVH